MRAKQLGRTLNSRQLNALIQPLRRRDNVTNLVYIALDYLTLAAVIVPTIAFCHLRASWGIHWAWTIPIVAAAVMLVGAVQHRFAGMAHEGSHYMLLKNRWWGELVSDWFCMFPLFSTTAQYRLIHLGHHEFTNDWERDPEIVNLGKTRMMDRFPMSKALFLLRFHARIFWPPSLVRYMLDNIFVTTLGNGKHPYDKTLPANPPGRWKGYRITSLLGIGYVALMVGVMGLLSYVGTSWQLAAAPIAMLAVAVAVAYVIPENWYFRSDLVPVHSPKFTSALRMTWITGLEFAIAFSRWKTGTEWGVYLWLLWVLPLFTSFPYYMLIRDMYQHANADDGKLTNSRVMFCNPITRWALFVYGQDIHLTHHLYPCVPHYNLTRLHQLLKENNAEYAEHVVECHGMFHNSEGKLTMLDIVEIPTQEPPEDAQRTAA